MAEPTIALEVNEGSEATPSWAAIGTALRFTGPEGIGDAFAAPVNDGDDAFFDAAADPNDGEVWHDTTTDAQIDEAGRNGNRNVVRANETGGADGTADPPEFTAYDDAADASSRTNPTIWFLVGTSGSGNISQVRAVETTDAAGSTDGWQSQIHDTDPQTTGTGVAADGFALDGNQAGEKVVCAAALAAGGSKEFNIAACLPHDATAGQSSFVWTLQYTFT